MKQTLFISMLIAITPFALLAQTETDQANALDSLTNEITVSYRTRNNLLVIPFMINDSLKVNLLLDPRCKSVILFGKRYGRWLQRQKSIESYHTGRKSFGSYRTKVSIGPASAENVSIVVVPNTSFFNFFTSVNGVIGSDFLANYELTIHERTETVTIRHLQNKPVFSTRHDPGIRFRGLNVSN